MAHHGAVLWLKVAGPKIKERIERERDDGPVYQQAAELLMLMDLPFLTPADLGIDVAAQTADGAPPEGGATLTPEQARDMAAEAAQRFAQG
jgi:hypothetical protein